MVLYPSPHLQRHGSGPGCDHATCPSDQVISAQKHQKSGSQEHFHLNHHGDAAGDTPRRGRLQLEPSSALQVMQAEVP